jgi:hypothetical protein
MTAEEKEAAEVESLVLDYIEVIEHKDLDIFKAAVNTANEAATAYSILKANPLNGNFFAGSNDV